MATLERDLVTAVGDPSKLGACLVTTINTLLGIERELYRRSGPALRARIEDHLGGAFKKLREHGYWSH